MKNYFKIPNVSYRAWKVWLRNKDAFMKTAKANFIVPFLEPIFYLLAIGFGLGFYIGEINNVSYPVFIAPALICISIMYSAFFECTYGSFVRMYYQKTFDAIIATPLNIDEVIFGEILWGSTKSVINASIMLLVVSIFHLVKLPDSILIIPLAFIVGFTFSTIAMCFTAISPTIDSFNYPTFLFITPMVFLSGTFFPLSILPKLIQSISFVIFPLTHALYISRELTTGALELRSILSLIWLTTVGAILLILSINLMRKRLIV
ncbi:MAG: ABC transporter permease [Candidatus Bathyarchaeia archaeon]